jgi:hypothetical protein
VFQREVFRKGSLDNNAPTVVAERTLARFDPAHQRRWAVLARHFQHGRVLRERPHRVER